MELRQLRYFIAVAECLSFSKAAEELHITVPPLSRQIRQLEEEFDVQLLVRNRRRVILSDAGRLFLREAKTLADQMTRFTNCVRLAAQGDAGTVRIGISLHLGDRLSRAVAEHSKQYPLVELQTAGIFPEMQNAALVEGKIDVGFLHPPIDRLHLKSEILFEEHLAVLMNKSNPLSKRKVLRVRDLADETLLLQDRRLSGGLHDKVLELLAKSGVSPRIVQLPADPLPNEEGQRVLLAANRGIYIVADEAPARLALGCAAAAVPLQDADASVEVHMVWRKNEASATVLAFLASVRRVFGTPLPARPTQLRIASSGIA
ncbi:MAG: LysR family transcriptional regulator [Candidatus Acidiferrales bacterium]